MSRLASPLLAVLLLLTSGLVFGLASKNRSLVEQVRSLSLTSPTLGKRDFVPSINVATHAGDSIKLGTGTQSNNQVLFVFNTSCPYCEQTLPAWSSVRESLRPHSAVSHVGVSLDSTGATRSYVNEHLLDFPIVSLTDERSKALLGLQRVPHTLVIGDNGRVLYSRVGTILDQATIDSIIAVALIRES